MTLSVIGITIAVLQTLNIGEWGNSSTFIPAISCFVVALPMYLGRKKAIKELETRKTQ
jgi:hypothetical protein